MQSWWSRTHRGGGGWGAGQLEAGFEKLTRMDETEAEHFEAVRMKCCGFEAGFEAERRCDQREAEQQAAEDG